MAGMERSQNCSEMLSFGSTYGISGTVKNYFKFLCYLLTYLAKFRVEGANFTAH